MMVFRLARARFLVARLLALAGALAFVGMFVAIVNPPASLPNRWVLPVLYVVVAIVSWACAFRLERPRSRGARTGHVVLFEAPMPHAVSQTPALTIRGARDAVERFIPKAEFNALFGGWALWAPPVEPIAELPGEALGVWGRRTCKRFRRILRERGATIEVRREPGPRQQIAQLVAAEERP